jgi:hypothetical protein
MLKKPTTYKYSGAIPPTQLGEAVFGFFSTLLKAELQTKAPPAPRL